MSAASNYLENEILDHILGKGARDFPSPGNLYLALFKETGTGTLANLEAGILSDEVTTGSGYSRPSVSFNTAASGSATNSTTSTWSAATASWGTVTAIAVIDSSTVGSGNVLFYGNLNIAKNVDDGDTFQVAAAGLTISLA